MLTNTQLKAAIAETWNCVGIGLVLIYHERRDGRTDLADLALKSTLYHGCLIITSQK